MVICDTCERPFHLQCCHPRRSEVPPGPWHCHWCDEAFANTEELCNADEPILFARPSDPFWPQRAGLISRYVRAHALGAQACSAANGDLASRQAQRDAGVARAEATLHHLPSQAERRSVRRQAKRLRVHPTQPDWYVKHVVDDETGSGAWLAVPPVAFRWGVIGACHDRLGHGGMNVTLAAVQRHYTWPGVKADVQAFVRQCHACQIKRLENEEAFPTATPRMSLPMEHLHIDLAGPFALRSVKDGAAALRGRSRTRDALSTQVDGTAYVCLVVDYFTKAAEFVVIPDKSAASVARAFHDSWVCRYGVPEWVTSDNGREFAGAFAHQLRRLGIEHVQTSAYHPQANGAVERLVRTMKEILAAKVAGAMHDWPAVMPQVRAEYMDRVHSSTGFSPNQLVLMAPVRLPPPVGGVSWAPDALTSSADPVLSRDASAFRASRAEQHRDFVEAAYQRILRKQGANHNQQARRLAAKRRRGGKRRLQVGDLAYLLETRGLKQKALGPYVVVDIGKDTVTLRTTERVAGQTARTWSVHGSRVARATTVVDVLEDLLKASGMPSGNTGVEAAQVASFHLARATPSTNNNGKRDSSVTLHD